MPQPVNAMDREDFRRLLADAGALNKGDAAARPTDGRARKSHQKSAPAPSAEPPYFFMRPSGPLFGTPGWVVFTDGLPSSVNGLYRNRQGRSRPFKITSAKTWDILMKTCVMAEMARRRCPVPFWPKGPLAVCSVWLVPSDTSDVDNRLKPFHDAFESVLYTNDAQIRSASQEKLVTHSRAFTGLGFLIVPQAAFPDILSPWLAFARGLVREEPVPAGRKGAGPDAAATTPRPKRGRAKNGRGDV